MFPTDSVVKKCMTCQKVFGCYCKNSSLICEKDCTTQELCETIIVHELGKSPKLGFCPECAQERLNKMFPGEGRL